MKKKNLIIISIVMLLIVTFFTLQKVNNGYYVLWNTNSFEVTATEPLLVEKVKIEYGLSANTINRDNDFDLFKDRNKYTILFNGTNKENVENMENEYGENDFLITYDNKYYFSFRHFKFNRHHQHKYIFDFHREDSTILVRAKIIGQDDMNFERPMNKITEANQLKCNGKIDSNKINYNMIELTYPQ